MNYLIFYLIGVLIAFVLEMFIYLRFVKGSICYYTTLGSMVINILLCLTSWILVFFYIIQLYKYYSKK